MSAINKKQRTSSIGSQSTSLVEVDADDYTCPICYEMMTEEIFQCVEGHMICKSCVGRVKQSPKRCPSCRIPYPAGSPIRNRAAEQIVSKMTLSCKYGCDHTARASEMQLHLRNCPRRLIKCQCGKVMPLADLTTHYKQEHNASYSTSRPGDALVLDVPMAGFNSYSGATPIFMNTARVDASLSS
eukprot:TRINITY_DN25965_c2_g1_i1.p1 TRINITY_DN25965_c2_g1~~TRINITY_DN25965_c2_g1_i1.p1  ORF type:complete len:185 (-),score=6.49 TRINITY_DN25965_c2_g1_i1:618-1172(-)